MQLVLKPVKIFAGKKIADDPVFVTCQGTKRMWELIG